MNTFPNTNDTFHFNSFVRRQTMESCFSHWAFSDEEMFKRIKGAIENGRVTKGYRDGVVLAHVHASGFFTGQVRLVEGDKLVGAFESRRDGEFPRKTLKVLRDDPEKIPAVAVDVVLYHSEVLAEDGSNEIDDGWEIVSVNARATAGEEPIHPEVFMYNHFGSEGGTDTGMTSEQFEEVMRKSFLYWKDRAVLAPKED